MAASSFDVRIWTVRTYERRRGKTFGHVEEFGTAPDGPPVPPA